MNGVSPENNRKEDDDDDDDDDVIIIENPRPKPKPPLIILCELSDDDEDQENKDVISLDDRQTSPDVIDIGSEPEGIDVPNDEPSTDDPTWSNKTSSCYKTSSSNINPLPDYIPLECDTSSSSTKLNGLSSSKSSYTCPECRADLSTVKMLYKHIQFRHPSSFHKYQHNTTPELQDKFQSPGNASQQRLKLNPLRSPISAGSTTSGSADISNTSTCTLSKTYQEPSMFVPLPSLVNRRTGINQEVTVTATTTISGTSTVTDSIYKVCQPLPSLVNRRTGINQDDEVTVTATTTISGTSTVTDSIYKVCQPLPSLVNRRTGINQDDKVTVTATSTTSGTSMATDSINKNCQPLKVVIYSPNSERGGNNRYVQISPLSTDKQDKTDQKLLDNGNENKTTDVIELFDSPCRDPAAVIAVSQATSQNESRSSCRAGPPPCKRKRQDPLLLIAEDDDNEQEMSRRPAKNKKDGKEKRIPYNRSFSCNVHGKTFSTREALLQHYRAKHQNETNRSNVIKSKKNYSLRPRNNLNVHPFPSSTSTPPSMDKLKTMKHIIMIDIDNWQKIFESDLTFSPSTFVWGFHGGLTSWSPPVSSSLLNNLKRMNCFYLHPKCGKSKDAADFALCVQAGKLDVLLPKDIIFTVLSGDKGFNELQNQLSLSKREVHIVNPHHKTIDTVLTILNSIAEK